MTRYVNKEQAERQGFGALFGVASDYARLTDIDEYADGVSSPFPVAHDGGMLHFIWVSGCVDGVKSRAWKDREQAQLASPLRAAIEDKSHPIIEGTVLRLEDQ